MELNLRPAPNNAYPLNGLLIRGSEVREWLCEIELMGLARNDLQIFTLPGLLPNSVYGCFIHMNRSSEGIDFGKNELCQQVNANVFIAERSELFPSITNSELSELFPNSTWLFHPEIGLVELNESVNFVSLLVLPNRSNIRALPPIPVKQLPKSVRSFQLAPIDMEKALSMLEEKIVPKKKQFKDEPLNLFEKIKMSFYRLQFNKPKGASNTASQTLNVNKSNTDSNNHQSLNVFGKFMSFVSKPFRNKNGGAYHDSVKHNLEELERRNQKEIDKLLNMLRNNPAEALKYAIPLDFNGSSRGTEHSALQLSKLWNSFGLFGNPKQQNGNSGTINLGDHFQTLNEQYKQTALTLKSQGDYEKAAFIYMKLLKDYRTAASTLEEGKMYSEAASMYMKHLNDKHKAADCYVQGKLYANAITLYQELHEYETLGDLYVKIHQRKEADIYFEQAALNELKQMNYMKSAQIYREKMFNIELAQNTLLDGWKADKSAAECLKTYFNNYQSPDDLEKELKHIYKTEVNASNREKFLKVLKSDAIHGTLPEVTKEMAYEIISAQAKRNPSIVKELNYFASNNKGLAKDAVRFSISSLALVQKK